MPRPSGRGPFAFSAKVVLDSYALAVDPSTEVNPGSASRLPLPENRTLAQVTAAYRASGARCIVLDDRWRLVYLSDETDAVIQNPSSPTAFYFGPGYISRALEEGSYTINDYREDLARFGGWILSDLGIDRAALRTLVHADLSDVVDGLEASLGDALAYEQPSRAFAGIVVSVLAQRIRDESGAVVGTIISFKPSADMNTLFMLAGSADPGHLARTRRLATAGRRPAAVLFADLEGSAQLARRLPTASYLTLVRRLTRAADRCVIDAGGLVGRHVGDGVASFFAAESAGSESAAAFACISAARGLQASMPSIAERHDLDPEEVVVRAGLHWGATLYIGSIITAGRSEVTALGDEVNEAARIEACAAGGRALASKALIERLDPDHAAALGIDPNRVAYVRLADLGTATEKARRDAPAVPVCDVAERADSTQASR